VGRCRYCKEKTREIDYKDLGNLQRMLSAQGKMLTRKRSGLCAMHQRSARRAIKRARFIGLLPFVA
jgi:small subunit ribosomal protein S18